MSQRQQLVAREPLNPFSDQTKPYINFQWLAQVGLYQTYHLGELIAGRDTLSGTSGGVAMLRTLTVLLVTAYYGLLLIGYSQRSGSWALACAGLIVSLLLKPLPMSVLRPQTFGQVAFAGLLVFFARANLSRLGLLTVPLVFVVWVNLHGSFLVGLAFIGLCLVGRAIEAALGRENRDVKQIFADRTVRQVGMLLVLCILAAGICNPHGPGLYRRVLEMGANLNVRTMVEWQPLELALAGGTTLFYFMSALVLVASFTSARKWPSPTEWLLILFFGLLPIIQRRMLIWWMPLVPWLAMRSWARVVETAASNWLRRDSVPSLRKTIGVGILVVALLPWLPMVRWLTNASSRSLDTQVTAATPWRLAAQLVDCKRHEELFSTDLAEAIVRQYPGERFTGRIFASETAADYLLWALPPEWPALVYSHAHLFPVQHWQDFLSVRRGEPAWKNILSTHRVNLVVVETKYNPVLCRNLRADSEWITARPLPNHNSPLFVAIRREPIVETSVP
jgi:hypothetical protein